MIGDALYSETGIGLRRLYDSKKGSVYQGRAFLEGSWNYCVSLVSPPRVSNQTLTLKCQLVSVTLRWFFSQSDEKKNVALGNCTKKQRDNKEMNTGSVPS